MLTLRKLALGIAATFSLSLPATATNLKVLIPFYNNPSLTPNSWDELLRVARANPSVNLSVIINPDNGPGIDSNNDYKTRLQALDAAGVEVLGYVSTGYGACFSLPTTNICPSSTFNPAVATPRLAEVEADILRYQSFYNSDRSLIDGIFFDEVANNTTMMFDFYAGLDRYAKEQNFDRVVANMGQDPISAYDTWSQATGKTIADVLVTYEGFADRWEEAIVQNNSIYSSKDAVLLHSVGFGDTTALQKYIDRAVTLGAGYLYVTDDDYNIDRNPWDTLPSFFDEKISYIAGLNLPKPAGTSESSSPIWFIAVIVSFFFMRQIQRIG